MELAVILPILILLMVLVAEVGFLLRNYILVCNANRESARLAARGRYSDQRIGERAIATGGIVRISGSEVPFLRTHGTEPNTGIIITHIPMDTAGEVISVTTWISGVVTGDDGSMRAVYPGQAPDGLSPDSHIDLSDIRGRHKATTQDVNQLREDALHEPTENHVVVVETLFAHEPLLLTALLPMPATIPMRAQTTVRVTLGHAEQSK